MALPQVSCVLPTAVVSAALQSLTAVLHASVGVIAVWPTQAVGIVVQAMGGIDWSDWSASRQVISAAWQAAESP